MHHVRQENLQFIGSSHEFVGAEQGDTSISVFLYHGKPGSGPGPHRHPYDEIQFIREGRGVWTVNGKTFEGAAGDIFVIKAGENSQLQSGWRLTADTNRRSCQSSFHTGEPVVAGSFWIQRLWEPRTDIWASSASTLRPH
jgi:cupin domain